MSGKAPEWLPSDERGVARAGELLRKGALVAIPTDLVDTPVFGREVPPSVQPLLQLAAVGVLVWALGVRLRGERACPVR